MHKGHGNVPLFSVGLVLVFVLAACAGPDGAISDQDPQPPAQQPRAAGTVTGRVVDGRGQPVMGALIAITAPGRNVAIPEIGILTDEDGRYTTISLPGGRYELTVSAAGFTSATKAVVVAAGVATPLDFMLLPGT